MRELELWRVPLPWEVFMHNTRIPWCSQTNQNNSQVSYKIRKAYYKTDLNEDFKNSLYGFRIVLFIDDILRIGRTEGKERERLLQLGIRMKKAVNYTVSFCPGFLAEAAHQFCLIEQQHPSAVTEAAEPPDPP